MSNKYMGAYYWTRNDYDLRVLRSKKYNRLTKIRREVMTWTVKREIATLQEQIGWIDAVLKARAEQTAMF